MFKGDVGSIQPVWGKVGELDSDFKKWGRGGVGILGLRISIYPDQRNTEILVRF